MNTSGTRLIAWCRLLWFVVFEIQESVQGTTTAAVTFFTDTRPHLDFQLDRERVRKSTSEEGTDVSETYHRVVENDIIFFEVKSNSSTQSNSSIESTEVRKGRAQQGTRWPRHSDDTYHVYYNATFPSTFSTRLKENILWAFEYLHRGSALRFVPRTDQENYITFRDGPICYSHIGMIGGSQDLQLNSFLCYFKGAVLHELLHALGFVHEIGRKDRDKYIDIFPDNTEMSFEFMAPVVPTTTHYDLFSIMHYPIRASSKDGAPSWLPKNRVLTEFLEGYRTTLSGCDWYRIHEAYPSPKGVSRPKRCRPGCIAADVVQTARCQLFGTPSTCAFQCLFNNAALLEASACEFQGRTPFPVDIPERCKVVKARPRNMTMTTTMTPSTSLQKLCHPYEATHVGNVCCFKMCLQCPTLFPLLSPLECMAHEFPECQLTNTTRSSSSSSSSQQRIAAVERVGVVAVVFLGLVAF